MEALHIVCMRDITNIVTMSRMHDCTCPVFLKNSKPLKRRRILILNAEFCLLMKRAYDNIQLHASVWNSNKILH
jgi:hypothetical protein